MNSHTDILWNGEFRKWRNWKLLFSLFSFLRITAVIPKCAFCVTCNCKKYKFLERRKEQREKEQNLCCLGTHYSTYHLMILSNTMDFCSVLFSVLSETHTVSHRILFWPCPRHAEVPRPGIEPQQQLEPLQWQHQILNPLHHKGTPTYFHFNHLLRVALLLLSPWEVRWRGITHRAGINGGARRTPGLAWLAPMLIYVLLQGSASGVSPRGWETIPKRWNKVDTGKLTALFDDKQLLPSRPKLTAETMALGAQNCNYGEISNRPRVHASQSWRWAAGEPGRWDPSMVKVAPTIFRI